MAMLQDSVGLEELQLLLMHSTCHIQRLKWVMQSCEYFRCALLLCERAPDPVPVFAGA